MCNALNHRELCICGFGPAVPMTPAQLRQHEAARRVDRLIRNGPLRRLRISLSNWRRDGWLPIAIEMVERNGHWTIVHAIWIDAGCDLTFRVNDVVFAPNEPAIARPANDLLGDLEIAYVGFESGEIVGSRAIVQRLPLH